VTGAAGFVGANLARRLLADGDDVHLLDRPGSRHWRIEELLNDVALHEADLEDAEAVARAVEAVRPERIFHLAARGAYSWQGDVGEILRVNVLGTANLLEAATRCGFAALVYAGTSSEYGFKDHAPAEDETLAPTSTYAVAKASATLLCQHFARASGHRVVTLRLYSTFGPWEEPGRLLPNLILRGLEGELPSLVSPDVAHDFVYVDDVVDAFIRAAATDEVEPGAIFNVGSGVQTTLATVVSLTRKLLEIDVEPRWDSMPAKAWDTDVWVADNRRISQALAWTPKHTFEQGLQKQIDWIRNKPELRAIYQELSLRRTADGLKSPRHR
jgi:nucleoside-diphosphate-sugar epimerase